MKNWNPSFLLLQLRKNITSIWCCYSTVVIIDTLVPLNKPLFRRALAAPCKVDFGLSSSCNAIKILSISTALKVLDLVATYSCVWFSRNLWRRGRSSRLTPNSLINLEFRQLYTTHSVLGEYLFWMLLKNLTSATSLYSFLILLVATNAL